jgi:hypothetical protein
VHEACEDKTDMEKDRVAASALHHDSSAAKQLTQYSKLQTLHCNHCVSKQLRGGAPPRRNSPSIILYYYKLA